MEFDWVFFFETLISLAFLQAAGITLLLTVFAHMTAIILGFPLAFAAKANWPALRWFAKSYVWLFRGAPTLLQLLFVWNALPQVFPALKGDWFTPFIAAWVALSLNEAAYQAEITRSALNSIDSSQKMAGMSLGMSRWSCFWYVMLPQALRTGIPPTGNEFITLLKVTSLASVISLQELIAITSQAIAASFKYMELYAAALVYYLVIVSALMLLQGRVERKLSWTVKANKRRQITLDPGSSALKSERRT